MDIRAAGIAALVAIVWGLCFVLIQASLPNPAPLLLAAMRALIGGATLAAAFLVRRRVSSRKEAGGIWPFAVRAGTQVEPRAALPSPAAVLGLALANAALAFGAMYLAASRAEAAVASVLASGQPLVLAAAGWLWFGERGSPWSVAGLSLGLGGVMLVATTSSGATTPAGVGLALLATVAPAAGTVVMRQLRSSVDLLATAAVQFLVGGAILATVSALVEPWSALSWSAATLSGLLILGVIGTGLAYLAWFWLLGRLPLVVLGAALFLVPITGVLAAVATGDRLALPELVGIAAALAGIGLVAADPAGRRPQGPADERHEPGDR